MNFKYIYYCMLILLLASETIMGQNVPIIGEKCPDFTLDNVKYYGKSKVTLNDFKGKWLILDFWFTGCTSCIKSFPKINELHEKHKENNIQILLVGKNDKKHNGNIEEVFNRYKEKLNLKFPVAYDSLLGPKWGIRSMPHVIIINPEGIVKYITDGSDLTVEKIDSILDGKDVSLFPKDLKRTDFDTYKYGINDSISSEDNIIRQSLLTKWNLEKQEGYDINRFVKIQDNKNGYKSIGFPLSFLYKTAFFGQDYFNLPNDSLYAKISHKVILKVKDSSLFNYDYTSGKGVFNYYLYLPTNMFNRENLMSSMQRDLESAFGYKAYIDIQELPVWSLVCNVDCKEKLRPRGNKILKSFDNSSAAGFSVKNAPFKKVFRMLFLFLNDEGIPFIDKTGITGNVDFKIDAIMTNIEDIKKELQKQGLDLVRDTKKMKVLVISDPTPNN